MIDLSRNFPLEKSVLTLLFSRLLKYRGKAQYNLAVCIEFIHNATLLHDDVVDLSQLRRGRPTANAEFGNSSSVLVGDFLYTRAFQLYVEGKLQTRKWQDKEGNDRYTTEILGNEMNMLGGRQSSGDGDAYDQSQTASQSASSQVSQISEEDIPF